MVSAAIESRVAENESSPPLSSTVCAWSLSLHKRWYASQSALSSLQRGSLASMSGSSILARIGK